MYNKICTSCHSSLTLINFNKLTRSPDGYNSRCKKCIKNYRDDYQQKTNYNKNYQKQYYQENKDRLLAASAKWRKDNEDRRKIVDRLWQENNKEKIVLKNKNWRDANKEYASERGRKYREKNREHRQQINREWLQNNKAKRQKYMQEPHNKIAHRLRSRVYDLIKGKIKVASVTESIGCSIQELRFHLESKFQPGMTWDNYGLHGWHIDHIRPLSFFDLSNIEQFKQACHYTNLQPLWAKDNLAKSNKYNE